MNGKGRLAAAAAAALVMIGSGSAAALACPPHPVRHYARCQETAPPGDPAYCNINVSMAVHPRDVRIWVRTSVRQRVDVAWVILCPIGSQGSVNLYGDHFSARTDFARRVLGRVSSDGMCGGGPDVTGSKGGSITVFWSWLS